MAYCSRSPQGSLTIIDGKAAPAVVRPKILATPRSCSPWARISEVEALPSSTRMATGFFQGSSLGLTTNFIFESRDCITPSSSPSPSISQPAIPQAIRPIPPGFPRKSRMSPGASTCSSSALWNQGITCIGPRNMLKRRYRYPPSTRFFSSRSGIGPM